MPATGSHVLVESISMFQHQAEHNFDRVLLGIPEEKYDLEQEFQFLPDVVQRSSGKMRE
jgi:hypothetical protein